MKKLFTLILLFLYTLMYGQDFEPIVTPFTPGSGMGVGNPNALRSGNIGFTDHLGRTITATKTLQIKDTWVGTVDGFEDSSATITTYQGNFTAMFIYDGVSVEFTKQGGQYVRTVSDIQPLTCDMIEDDEDSTIVEDIQSTTSNGLIQQDILVAYTTAFKNHYGSNASAEAAIANAIAMANQVYVNSQVDILLNLVHAVEVNYTESGSLSTDLGRLRSVNDGFMDEIHPLREQYFADLIHLFTNATGGACGVAYLSGEYGVTARTCISGQTFTHEVGHNQGCHHDRETLNNTIVEGYRYGYRICGSFRTVMSYACGGAPRINFFSNPNILRNGVPIGIDFDVNPTQGADNSRMLRETAQAVANRRVSGSGSGVPNSPVNLSSPSVGRDRINLTWSDTSNNEDFFILQRVIGGWWSTVATLNANTTNYTDTGLQSGTTYQYRIFASNSVGNSLPSNTLSATTSTQGGGNNNGGGGNSGGGSGGGKGKNKKELSPDTTNQITVKDNYVLTNFDYETIQIYDLLGRLISETNYVPVKNQIIIIKIDGKTFKNKN
jgi:hypothetical protein